MKSKRFTENNWLAVLLGLFLMLLWIPSQGFAHHPAADIVDEEIYAMIDEMVADTPHAEIEFDDDMGNGDDTTMITTDTVSAAEDLIDEGLLADVSLLDGDVTVTIEFPDDTTSGSVSSPIYSLQQNDKENKSKKRNKWSEWGGPVRIIIHHVY